jgi:two-component system phosphate regulon response regulator PhoB
MGSALWHEPRPAHVSIIALSARSEEHDRIAALEGGADDYITKPFSMRELLARIKAVVCRRTPQRADDVVHLKGLRLDPAARRVSAGEHEIELWDTEFRMRHFFMNASGRDLRPHEAPRRTGRLPLDLYIIAETAWIVLRGENAH